MNPLGFITNLIPGLSWIKAGIALAGVAALGVLIWLPFHWKGQRDDLRAWQADVIGVTRLASDNPKLATKDVTLQITAMGHSLSDLKASTAHQNDEIERLKQASDEGAKRLGTAMQEADKRDASMKELRGQLREAGAQKPAPGCDSVPAAVLGRFKV